MSSERRTSEREGGAGSRRAANTVYDRRRNKAHTMKKSVLLEIKVSSVCSLPEGHKKLITASSPIQTVEVVRISAFNQ